MASDREALTTYAASGRAISLLNPESPDAGQPESASSSVDPAASTSPVQQTSSKSPSPLTGSSASPSSTPMRSKPYNSGRAAALARRRYVCNVCDKAFTTSGHLSRHTIIHTGDKPFICPYPKCHKKCSRDDNLVQHFQVHLPKEDRKRGLIYIRDAIAAMRNATDVSSAVLLLAGLPFPVAPAEGADVEDELPEDEHEDAEDEDHDSTIPTPTPTPSPVARRRRVVVESSSGHENGEIESDEKRPSRKRRRRDVSTSSQPTATPRNDLDTLAKAAAQIGATS